MIKKQLSKIFPFMKSDSKKTVSDWTLLNNFFKYLFPYKKLVLTALVAIPFTTGAAVLLPWLLVHIIDDYIMAGDSEGLYQAIILMVGAVLLGYLADGVYTFSLQKAGQQAISEIRKTLFSHALSLPRSYFDHHPIGSALSRITSDTEAMGESVATGALSLLTDLFKTIFLLAFLFYLSWRLSLLLILTLPVIFLAASFLRKKLRFYFNAARKILAESTSFLQESLNGVKTVQLYGAELKVIKKFKDKNKKFLRAQSRSNIYDASLFSLIDGSTSIVTALIIWYGGGQVLSGFITIGVLVGFINTLNRIFVPIREFTQQISIIQRSLSSLEHINELLLEKPTESDNQKGDYPTEQPLGFEELRFDKVYFKYPGEENHVLQNISFSLKKGEKLAIAGATGSGKTTILKLLTKTYEKYQGSITINGEELSEIPKIKLMSLVSIMHQDAYLFNESLSFNISLERPEITKEIARRAVEYVHAHEFIDQLPEKMETRIFGQGQNLSAGQTQLISFARAIAAQTEVIMLDEATSSVDSITENLIQKAIEKIFNDKTVIAIAHRLSTIRRSDKILVMKAGKIVESGNHQELIRQKGYYFDLLQKRLDEK